MTALNNDCLYNDDILWKNMMVDEQKTSEQRQETRPSLQYCRLEVWERTMEGIAGKCEWSEA